MGGRRILEGHGGGEEAERQGDKAMRRGMAACSGALLLCLSASLVLCSSFSPDLPLPIQLLVSTSRKTHGAAPSLSSALKAAAAARIASRAVLRREQETNHIPLELKPLDPLVKTVSAMDIRRLMDKARKEQLLQQGTCLLVTVDLE